MSNLDQVKNDILGCEWDPAVFMIFSEEVERLVYYTHLLPALACIVVFIILFLKSRDEISGRVLMVITGLFTIFAFADLSLWAISNPAQIMFIWSILTYIELLLFFACLYLYYTFTTNKHPNSKVISAMILLYVPVIILGPTSLNLIAFDYSNCYRLAIEGPLLWYVYFVEVVIVLWLILLFKINLPKLKDEKTKKANIYMTIGLLAFLFLFSLGNIFGTFMQDILGENAWLIGQYGFLGMPIFLFFILYVIVHYRSFNIRIVSTEALMYGIFILITSMLFVRSIESARIISLITLTIFTVLGYLLVKNIKKEVKQREELQKLTEKLKKANRRLEESDKAKSVFVSIASHQLRSPITSIRGYASLLLEGTYGKIPEKAREPLQRIDKSSKLMAIEIEDYLNISRIESGNMTYNNKDFNLISEVKRVCDDMRGEAVKEGLALFAHVNVRSQGVVHADVGKVVQILQSLLTNSIKYTKKGKIKVVVHDSLEKNKIYVDVIDTGIGMSKDTIDSLFEKFVRAHNANDVNIHGTGLGLFISRKLARAMGGDVTVSSEGDGKGSKFTLVLPLVS